MALTVSGRLPGGVVEEVETLSERELEVEIDAGLNDAEAPAGSPLTLSETGPLKAGAASDAAQCSLCRCPAQ